MALEDEGCYEFGRFRLDPAQQRLWADGKAVALTPKAFDTLLLLVRNSGRLVTKEELLHAVWPDVVVEEATLTQNVFRLRRALGDAGETSRYIETVPKRGYRFLAPVRTAPPSPSEPRSAVVSPTVIVTLSLLLAASLLAAYWYGHRVPVLTDRSSVVLADFTNATGDSVFDDALRQAITVHFQQTPFLTVVSRDRVSAALKLMRRAPDERLVAAIAREVCQRTGSRVLISGAISKLGTHFVIGLNASSCDNGDLLASEQVEAEAREKVLSRLADACTRIRAKLGESLASIQKYGVPVEQATTGSLEALQAYSRANRLPRGPNAIPLLKHAIQLDPNFVAAYSTLGGIYTDLGEYEAASNCYQKAYELRERLTEREQLQATADYYARVIGDLTKANETYRIWQQVYPRDAIPYNDLAYNYELAGEYDQELAQAVLANHIDPGLAAPYVHLMFSYAALGRVQDARFAYQQAEAHDLDDYPYTHFMMYQLATVADDAIEAQRQLRWSEGKPETEAWMLSFQSDAEAYAGRLRKAQALSARASQFLSEAGQTESAALVKLNAAWREAEYGMCGPARAAAIPSADEPATQGTRIVAALVLARCGDAAHALAIVDDIKRRATGNTLLNGYWFPTIQALVDLNRKDPRSAVLHLSVAIPYELGIPEPTIEEAAPFLPAYIRGRAYLLLHQGREAAAEFQKLLAYRAITTNSPPSALTTLQVARAYYMEGDLNAARGKYQEFLTTWKDADRDIPVLADARSEFANLRR
jgi:DNA-binding winged helix-turn-helix (wHTH) protein/tetratricopeptide (TPR) repeat protein